MEVSFESANPWSYKFGKITYNFVGQAISLMLGAIIPQYKNMENTLPAR
jgi:hypothetical protein